MFWKFVFILIIIVGISPEYAYALLPPDLIFSVGSQLSQFFAFITLFVGGVVTSVLVVSRQWLSISKYNIWKLVGIVFGVVLLVTTVIYFLDKNKQEVIYQEYIKSLEVSNGLLWSQLNEGSDGEGVWNKNFFSDSITLYSDELEKPFVLEVDLNRMEKTAGFFSHYTFLDGSWDGVSGSNYDALYEAGSIPQPNKFMTKFIKSTSSDLLNRNSYEANIMFGGESLEFSIDSIDGDFVIRSEQAYTQYISVATASVRYRGKEFMTKALIEGAHSNDYSKYIFFEGRETVDASTHQFILWDESSSFYMIDNSEVYSDTPAYPAHNWLLYKNGKNNNLKKSFQSDISVQTDQDGNRSWVISMPDFDNAKVEVSLVSSFKNGEGSREKLMVSGEITDNNGTRRVSGILHTRQ